MCKIANDINLKFGVFKTENILDRNLNVIRSKLFMRMSILNCSFLTQTYAHAHTRTHTIDTIIITTLSHISGCYELFI